MPSPLPPLTLSCAGRTIRFDHIAETTTLGELVAASDRVVVDGRMVAAATPVAQSGIRTGSRIEPPAANAADDGTRPAVEPVVWVAWRAGRDAGRRIGLAPGRHIVGRNASAAVRSEDPSVELHHAVLVVAEDGTILVEQLTGRQPLRRRDGEVDLGASSLAIVGVDAPSPVAVDRAATANDPWRQLHVRVQRATPSFQPVEVVVPQAVGARANVTGGGVLPSLLGIAASGVAAILFGQALFLAFGLIGGSIGISTWIAQRVGGRRTRRAAARWHRDDLQRFTDELCAQQCAARAAHLATTPTLERAIDDLLARSAQLWTTRATTPTALRAAVGEGIGTWSPCVATGPTTDDGVADLIDAAASLGSVPIAATFEAGSVLAIVADAEWGAAMARSIVLQLAAACGPADWQLVVRRVSDSLWDELAWLPHAVDSAGALRTDLADVDPGRFVVVVVEDPAELASRTSALRRAMGLNERVAVVALCRDEREIPAAATSVVSIDRQGRGRWIAAAQSCGLGEPFRPAGASARTAHDAAASIARLIDPESDDVAAGLPAAVSLHELLGATANGGLAEWIERQWATAEIDPSPTVPIGRSCAGVLDIDLALDGPHALIAGTTGSGKSELLRTMVVGLATRFAPELVTFVLVDYKGGSTFAAVQALPHVVGLVTDLDDHLADRAVRSLHAELRRREAMLLEQGVVDLAGYREAAAARAGAVDPMPRLVIVVDEFATLAVQRPAFIGALLGIAQRGRSLGMHLVLATQRPAGVVSDDIRANTNLRIALRVQQPGESVDVIDNTDAATLPRSVPGRALARIGSESVVGFQTARCDGIESAVAAICAAARRRHHPSPHAPWLPPLGQVVRRSDHPDLQSASAVLDDPDRQCRRPLHWDPSGHLLLAAATGFGATSAMLELALLASRRAQPPLIAVIDAIGDARWSLIESLPSVVAVVRGHDRERITRLLARLAATGERGGFERPVIVLIDGLVALRTALDGDGMTRQLDQLDTLIGDGLARGLTVVAATNQPSALPHRLLAQFADRWAFHLADTADAAILGVRTADSPPAIPGRIVDARSGLVGQLFPPDEAALLEWACSPAAGDPVASALRAGLASLPSTVRWRAADPTTSIGMSFDDLSAACLPVGDGEHVTVLGSSRSGRTSALVAIAHSWQRAHPAGTVVSLASRRSSARSGVVIDDVSALPPSIPPLGPVLVEIDDAELVDDATGVLARLAAARDERVTFAIAARPDALRSLYGHWTASVRRSRLGVVLSGGGDLDGDLLGAMLPRRAPLPARPGLAWIVAGGEHHLAQLYLPATVGGVCPASSPWGPPNSAPCSVTIPVPVSSGV